MMLILKNLVCLVLIMVLIFLVVILIKCLQSDVSLIILPLIGISSTLATIRWILNNPSK
ncbi:hypothetical protein SAMN04487851_1169 [Prevotella sp. tc2-28]|nr:hypothetical protein SAMN04487851_1169 [Prevotella sp. tc2-28]